MMKRGSRVCAGGCCGVSSKGSAMCCNSPTRLSIRLLPRPDKRYKRWRCMRMQHEPDRTSTGPTGGAGGAADYRGAIVVLLAWLGGMAVYRDAGLSRARGVWRGSTLPPRWLVLLAVVVPVVLLWLTLRTLVGREGGVALLLLLVGFKAFETQNLRDWRVLLTLGFFLAAMPLLFDQSPLAASWLVLTLLALTWAMALLAGTPPVGSGRTAVVSLLLALPLMLVLFVAMPRLPGPLWSMPDSRHTASTGLADSMEPGSISQLIPRHDPVFSVVFNEPAPPRRALYWRVMTFDDFDGQRWSNLHAIQQERVSLSGGQVWHYSLTTRPEEGRLPALDYPLPGSADTALAQGGTLRQLIKNDDLRRYRLASASGASVYARLSAQEQAFYRRLPAGNPQARQLAESLWQRSPDDRAWVQAALEHFRLEGFRYTLTPPRLAENSIDQFLFLTRQGFCEHYAGALTFLARAA
ncbi:DUF3488 domain-containing protein [Paludibacterium sp. dN 18-1]|uniref:DUF3488 domain-containing protein n=2 Tax=Paludibacterium denitrificans TaxID=2675226 RepID=A0A844GB17_9NEIS|nr:DUF3488 domain-containing protein [Paludibacterium denitrificans]